MFCLKCPRCKSGSLLGIGNKAPNKGIITVNESDLQCWYSVVANVTLLKFFIKSWLVMKSCDSSTPPNPRFSTRVLQHCLPLSQFAEKHIFEVNICHIHNYQARKWTIAQFIVSMNLYVLFLACNNNKSFWRWGEEKESTILLSI